MKLILAVLLCATQGWAVDEDNGSATYIYGGNMEATCLLLDSELYRQ